MKALDWPQLEPSEQYDCTVSDYNTSIIIHQSAWV